MDLEAIRSIWHRDPGAFSFADGMTEVERATLTGRPASASEVCWPAWMCYGSTTPTGPTMRFTNRCN